MSHNLVKVSTKEASIGLEISEQGVRIGMQRGKLPIGSAYKVGQNWRYDIYAKLIEDFAGENAIKRILEFRAMKERRS